MKATGMVRKVDELGRVVLPVELRRVLNIGIKDALEIFAEEDRIILRRYEPACVFCDNADKVVALNGRMVCKECIKKLYEEMIS